MRVNMEVVSPVPTQERGTDRRSPGHLRLLDPLLERRHLNRASFHPFFSDRRIPLTVQNLGNSEIPDVVPDIPEFSTIKAFGTRWAVFAMVAIIAAFTLRMAYRRDLQYTPVAIASTVPSTPADAGPVTQYQWSGYHRLAA